MKVLTADLFYGASCYIHFWVLILDFLCRHWMNYHLMLIQLRGVTTWILTLLVCQRFTDCRRQPFILQVAVQLKPTQLLLRTQDPVNHLILGNYIHHMPMQIQMEEDVALLACIQLLICKPFERRTTPAYQPLICIWITQVQPPPDTYGVLHKPYFTQAGGLLFQQRAYI